MVRRRGGAPIPRVERFERAEFVAERWAHLRGEHVTILAPTGWGKTTLAFDLLAPLSTPDEPSVILVMKARDETVSAFGKRMGFLRVRSWPPPISRSHKHSPIRPPGYLLWPKFTHDPDVDIARQRREFRAAMLGCMRRGGGVKVFADEVADLGRGALGLEKIVDHFLRQARSLDASMFCATQRPFNAPGQIYGGAMHLFIGNDPDHRSRKRYEEIGGIDPDIVTGITSGLQQYEWLYIRRARGRTGTVMCVVGP